MKKIVPFALILAVVLSTVGAIVVTLGEPSVGVKEGDWIEYTVETTGTPLPEHHLDWIRIEILEVEGAVFHANFTVRNANGAVSSDIRNFDFSEGAVGDWIIIPANLGVGDTFFDIFKQDTVSIEGQDEKIVVGASRTITHASDDIRYKEWDKSTGVFVASIDDLGNYTIDAQAIATNMWRPHILGLDESVFYALIAVIVVLVVLVLSLVTVLVRRKR
jgi:hypothetical protein